MSAVYETNSKESRTELVWGSDPGRSHGLSQRPNYLWTYQKEQKGTIEESCLI